MTALARLVLFVVALPFAATCGNNSANDVHGLSAGTQPRSLCANGEVFYTDGYGATVGSCKAPTAYPLNTPAYSAAVAVAQQCPAGRGVVQGDASTNEGKCR